MANDTNNARETTMQCFYIDHRPDWSHSRPYHAVQCGAGMLHRLLSGTRGFATLDEAVAWSRKFEAGGGYRLVSRDELPQWFTQMAGVPGGAVALA